MKTITRSGAELTSTVSGLADDALLAQTGSLPGSSSSSMSPSSITCARSRLAACICGAASPACSITPSGSSAIPTPPPRGVSTPCACARVRGGTRRAQDGSITLTTAAQLQNAFDRQKRNRRRRERGPVVGSGPAAPRQDSLLAPRAGPPNPNPNRRWTFPPGRPWSSRRPARARGRCRICWPAWTRAGVAGRQGAAAGQRALRDEGRDRRRVPPRAGADPGANLPRGPAHDVGAACRAAGARGARSPRPGPAAAPSAHRQPVRERGRNFGGAGASQRQHHFGAEDEAQPGRSSRSVAHRNAQPTRAATSAPKRSAPAARAIPAGGETARMEPRRRRCSYVDPRSRRRCASRHLLQIDHVFPYALGGRAEPANLRLLCATHHRHRHEGRASPRAPAE